MGLDLGRRGGWAIRLNDGGLISGAEEYAKHGLTRSGDGWARFNRHTRNLVEMHKVEMVWIEDVLRHMGVQAAHAFGGFRCLVQLVAYDYDLEFRTITPSRLKQFQCGKGNMKKEQALEIAAEKHFRPLGLEPKSDDEADAICVLLCGELEMKLEAEREALPPDEGGEDGD